MTKIGETVTTDTVMRCPTCNGVARSAMKAVDGPGMGDKPAAGNPGMCGQCGEVLVFQKDNSLRAMTAMEFFHLPKATAVWCAGEATRLRREYNQRKSFSA